MKILVCGSRSWTNRDVIRWRLAKLPPGTTVIHGDCRGADRLADSVARQLGFAVQRFPADWDTHGRAAGPIRNSLMLDQEPDEVIAFHHDNPPTSGGTADMVRKATAAGLPVSIVQELIIDYDTPGPTLEDLLKPKDQSP